MKIKSLLVYLLLLSCLRIQADPGDELRSLRLKLACEDRYRKVGEKLYDLSPRFFYEDEVLRLGVSQTFNEAPLPDWEIVFGKVLQVADDGILLEMYEPSDWQMNGESKLVFVHNYNHGVVDGSSVELFVTFAGRYSYVNTLGARKTIRAYDYGEIPKGEELEKLKAEAKQRAENYQKTLAAQKATADAMQAKKDEQGKAAAIKFLKEKAAEGAPMSQYRLAEKYLKGEGVPVDIEQAKFWLQCSCTNGYSEASNLLHRIQRDQLRTKP